MARTIFLTLLLLNLVALAWIYAKGDERINAGREPLRIKAQLVPDKIRLVAMTENSVSAAASDSLSTKQTGLSATPPSVAPVVAETCHGYIGATVKEAQQIAQTLAGKLPAARIAVNPIIPPSSFDMAITGLASRPLAEAKLAELKKLGIKDGAQIKAEDDKHFSLVIASFTERPAGEEALKAINKKGVTAASLMERKPVPEKSMIEIRGSESALKKLSEQMAPFKILIPAACAVQ